MVAKGHDFPDVTLGVVLDADSTLRFPDFRAEERTFALIAQLAGPRRARAARRPRARADDRRPTRRRSWPPPGTTPRASWPASSARREALRYPPFADLIRIVFLAEDGAAARAAAGRVGDALAARAGAGSEVLGPAPLFRLRGRERFQLVVKTRRRRGRDRRRAASVVERAARDRAHRHVAFSVDVDPQ